MTTACFEDKYEASAFITASILFGKYLVRILDSTTFKVIRYESDRLD